MGDFEEIYHRHVQAVFRFAVRCAGGRRDVAEDLTSEAFLELHRNRDSVNAEQLPSWLYKVVRNRATDRWRRDVREREYLEGFIPPPPPARGGMADMLGTLKPVHRTCLILRHVHGMTRDEIVAATGLSANQVKGHLQYGLQLLRRQLAA
jgi:RNA polymerase sigma-70 factor (ECF subfamily)